MDLVGPPKTGRAQGQIVQPHGRASRSSRNNIGIPSLQQPMKDAQPRFSVGNALAIMGSHLLNLTAVGGGEMAPLLHRFSNPD